MRSRSIRLIFPRLSTGAFCLYTKTGEYLPNYIGESLALLITDAGDTPLELIRFRRYGIGETIVVFRQPNRITLTITTPIHE